MDRERAGEGGWMRDRGRKRARERVREQELARDSETERMPKFRQISVTECPQKEKGRGPRTEQHGRALRLLRANWQL